MNLHPDLALARRLERTEAEANARFVESRANLMPHSGAEWIEVAGASAMFDGVHSPCTQTFGLGMFVPLTPDDLDQIEAFYQRHQAPVAHEVCPLADVSVAGLLAKRGYRPVEYSNVMYRSISAADWVPAPIDPATTARLTAPDEWPNWVDVAVAGWNEFAEYSASMRELMEVGARRTGALSFVAERDGAMIAAGALSLGGTVALLAGASTIPTARRRGAQLALLAARLRYALDHGCDVAMMVASPGSGSQRNAERHGFRVAYTRTKWSR